MNDHDDGHDERYDLDEARSAFEDDGVCKLNGSCRACCLNPRRAGETRRRSNESAEWKRDLLTYRREIAEPHGRPSLGTGVDEASRKHRGRWQALSTRQIDIRKTMKATVGERMK